MPKLENQRVLVTGAAQGLGAAIAQAFATKGAELILLDRYVPTWDVGRATVIQADLSDAAATEAAIAQIDAPVDVMIHNAGILHPQPLEKVSLEMFRTQLDVGIQAGFQLSQALWPGMKSLGGGAIIFVSSQSGIKGFVDETAYCAAKHALEGLAKCLALEGAAHGILSCTMTPGKAMRTPMSELNYPPELKAQWIDPARLAPAFVRIAEQRDMALSGERLNAWEMAQEDLT